MSTINDPLAPTLVWEKRPENVLVIKKLDMHLFDPFVDILIHLIYTHRLTVYIERSEYENDALRAHARLKAVLECEAPGIRLFVNETSTIDFVVCFGGDGTLLHSSALFQNKCPPVISIHGGSLGFLCPFDFENYKNYLNGVIKGNVPLMYRNRLKFSLEKSLVVEEDMNKNDDAIENGSSEQTTRRESSNDASSTGIECLAINEIIISRGCNSYLSNLDLYINDYLVTTVQGDGLIVSTPTGSTAYAMAAGASMCHPSVQAAVIAPICPHSLSFRPIVVPFGVELKIALNPEARSCEAWCSVDGRMNTRLTRTELIRITASQHPLPFICRSDQVNEWFEGLAVCLHWNERPRQLPLNSGFISKSRSPSRSRSHSSFCSASALSSSTSSLSSSRHNLLAPNSNALISGGEHHFGSDSYETLSFKVPDEFNIECS